MDYKVINKAIAVTETVFDGVDERPVDCDFVLPDYYPDIAAVLKCTLKPVIQSKQLSGDRLIVDGTVVIQVLYLDEARLCVRSCEFAKPYTSTFNVKAGAVNPAISVTAKTEYVNCRAVSPRRLDVHGAFTVRLKMTAEGGGEIVSNISGDTMYTRRNVLACSVPAISAEKSFTISEVLELGESQPAAQALIRGDAVPVLSDCRIMANKVIIKGILMLNCLYVSDITNGDTQKTRYEIPFSQIVDVDGLDEEYQCEIGMDVTGSEIHISSNQSGEGRLLEVSFKLTASVQCHRTDMVEIVTDAFSSSCPVECQSRRLDTRHLIAVRHDSPVIHETFDMPSENIADILDVWCEAVPLSERCEDGVSVIDGRLMIYMLAKDEAGVVSFYERPADFKLNFEDGCTGVSSRIAVTRVDNSMAGADRLEVKAQLDVNRCCFVDDSMVAVTSVTVNENTPFPNEKAALKIYFAKSGESVWEVAKSCHTSMDAVIEENALNGDVLDKDTMLLVPLC